ncbi:MAG: GPR1/FUN34/YaaH family transporter [Gemmatimonadota bacterium]|jgi:succinate-acetate transporter protein
MGDRVADPKALGFGAFAMMAWVYSMQHAGWYANGSYAATLHGAAAFATVALLIAALASFLRGETWHAVFFMFWSALLMGYRAGPAGVDAVGGWYLLTIALVSFFLFLRALKDGLGVPVVLLAIGVALSFLLYALGSWLGGVFWVVVGGYVGLLTALATFWAAASALGIIGGGAGGASSGAVGGGSVGGGMSPGGMS